jgi:lysozyme
MDRRALAALSLSGMGLVAIVMNEGYNSTAYIPLKGDVPTIGFGTTKGVKLGDRTTPQDALKRALTDINQFEGALKQCVKVPLTQGEYDAYISLSYNIGSFAFCNSTLVKRLNAGRYEDACTEILQWDRFKGQKLAGLTKRRTEEYHLCLGS